MGLPAGVAEVLQKSHIYTLPLKTLSFSPAVSSLVGAVFRYRKRNRWV